MWWNFGVLGVASLGQDGGVWAMFFFLSFFLLVMEKELLPR
jgi:hypothetical protein